MGMMKPDYDEFCCRTKTYAGHREMERIPELLNDAKSTTPFMLSDHHVREAGLMKRVSEAMDTQKTVEFLHHDIEDVPRLDSIRPLVHAYRKNGCDALIAVGGGSVINAAKTVNLMVSEAADDPRAYVRPGALTRPLKPLIAIPAPSGSGSEASCVAVIHDLEHQVNFLLTSPFFLPDVVMLDSRMTLAHPAELTAAAGMNALTLAAEALFAPRRSLISDTNARKAVELITGNLVRAVQAPRDKEARLSLAIGANIAGIAAANAGGGMTRAIGEAVGAVYGVLQNKCMAILLPYCLEQMLREHDANLSLLLLSMGGDQVYLKTPERLRARKAIAMIHALNDMLFKVSDGRHAIALKDLLADNGEHVIPREGLRGIIKRAMSHASFFDMPQWIDETVVFEVLEHAWQGRPSNDVGYDQHQTGRIIGEAD